MWYETHDGHGDQVGVSWTQLARLKSIKDCLSAKKQRGFESQAVNKKNGKSKKRANSCDKFFWSNLLNMFTTDEYVQFEKQSNNRK